ncbi:MAG: (2Fe-2S)-binding protein [Acidobacteria bacterium]|nr:(2Fe-2S)-binding protein [Acidobacteriota bacterium]
MIDSDLFEPYERLVTIEILGRRVGVPENNRLLRCFQFLSMRSISYGDFCWNGDCTNCQFWYHDKKEFARDDKTALSCRFKVREGMVVTRLNEHVQLEGINQNKDEGGRMKDEIEVAQDG